MATTKLQTYNLINKEVDDTLDTDLFDEWYNEGYDDTMTELLQIAHEKFEKSVDIEVETPVYEFSFATTTERDDYFTANPGDLVDGVIILLVSLYQEYDLSNTTWVDMNHQDYYDLPSDIYQIHSIWFLDNQSPPNKTARIDMAPDEIENSQVINGVQYRIKGDKLTFVNKTNETTTFSVRVFYTAAVESITSDTGVPAVYSSRQKTISMFLKFYVFFRYYLSEQGEVKSSDYFALYEKFRDKYIAYFKPTKEKKRIRIKGHQSVRNRYSGKEYDYGYGYYGHRWYGC